MVQVVEGKGGLPKVVLDAHDGSTAEVYLLGAHVASWQPAVDRAERLFLSARSEFQRGVAIRGGIPVIFPQFAAEGPLPRHGFARTADWTLADHGHEGTDAIANFTFADSDTTRAIWPASFVATLTVRVGGDRLTVTLAVENTGAEPFAFTSALHTYLRVDNVHDAELVGLHGSRYRESGAPTSLAFESDEVIHVHGALDRVYVDARSPLTLREPRRSMRIEQKGFVDVVVWNPGAERATALADMEPGGELRMLCVEAAAVQVPIELRGGRRWTASQMLTAHANQDAT